MLNEGSCLRETRRTRCRDQPKNHSSSDLPIKRISHLVKIDQFQQKLDYSLTSFNTRSAKLSIGLERMAGMYNDIYLLTSINVPLK